MVFSILPAFFTSILKAGTESLGLLDGIAEASSNFFKIYSGPRRGRPGTVAHSYATAFVFSDACRGEFTPIIVAFFVNPPSLLV
jgi:hypothetical protein